MCTIEKCDETLIDWDSVPDDVWVAPYWDIETGQPVDRDERFQVLRHQGVVLYYDDCVELWDYDFHSLDEYFYVVVEAI